MSHRGYREASKLDWGVDQSVTLDREQVHLGAMLRIADATEKMSARYVGLLDEVERLRRCDREQRDAINRLQRSISALKGVVTKMKGKP